MSALPPLPEVLRGYPVTARWIYQTVRMSEGPLSQRQVAALLGTTFPGVSNNVKLLTANGLLTARRGVLTAVTGEALARAKPFTAKNADLGPTVINGEVKHAVRGGKTRFRFGHPPIHIFYVVTQAARGEEAPVVMFALADTAREAASVLHPGKQMPVRQGYHMREDGEYEWVLPPFTTLRSAKQKAAQAGAEKGTPYQVVRFKDGLYTAIPEGQPLPAGAESAFVQPPTGSGHQRKEPPAATTATGDGDRAGQDTGAGPRRRKKGSAGAP